MRLLLDTHIFLWSVISDRLLAAQAISEALRLQTSDAQLSRYSELVTLL